MATPPPTPPSPPKGDGTPDAGNPAGAAPPEVAPKPGRQSARKSAGSDKKPVAKRRTTTPKAAPSKAARTTGAGTKQAAKAPASTASRAPVKPRAAGRPRAAKLSVAAAPARQPIDLSATDAATWSRGGWWRAIAGGIGALAAGAALFSLRGSTRRKARQADGTDSSKPFDAGIADESTIPDEPANR